MLRIRLIVEFFIVGVIAFFLIKISNSVDELKHIDNPAPKVEVVASAPAVEAEAQEEALELHSLDEVNQRFAALPVNVKAHDLALAISEVDSWMIEPASEKLARNAIDQHVLQLRSKVVSEVKVESQKALATTNGRDASKLLNGIGLLVSLYPMGDKPEIIEQARQLTDDQRKLAVKLEGMKRLRYNKWAVIRISQALDGYHKSSSLWSPKKENKALVDSLVKYLAEVDPNLLEPTVMSLYTYTVEITKESISEKDRVSLATKLTEPKIQRLSFEDF